MPAARTRKKTAPKKPLTLAQIIDKHYRTREKRLKLKKQCDELSKEEHELERTAHALMKDQGLEKAAGRVGQVSVTTKPISQVLDWPAFLEWCVKHEGSGCVQRRVNASEVEQRLLDGDEVPGVKIERDTRLHLSKRGAR